MRGRSKTLDAEEGGVPCYGRKFDNTVARAYVETRHGLSELSDASKLLSRQSVKVPPGSL